MLPLPLTSTLASFSDGDGSHGALQATDGRSLLALRGGKRSELVHKGAGEVDYLISVGDGVARVSGLENVMSSELVELPNDTYGMALNLEEDNVGLVLFGDSSLVKEGDLAKRTGQVVEVPVGDAMVGRVVDPLGQAMDGKGSITSKDSLPIERKALGVMACLI